MNKTKISFLIALIGTILLLVSLFLPYATAIGDHADSLKKHSDTIISSEMNLSAKDSFHFSMVEYAGIYGKHSTYLFGDSATGLLYTALVILIGVFSLLALLFVLRKKPIASFIFTLLSFSVFSLQNWDYTDRGVIPSSGYDWGIGYYIFFAATFFSLVGAIWMLLLKHRAKADETP